MKRLVLILMSLIICFMFNLEANAFLIDNIETNKLVQNYFEEMEVSDYRIKSKEIIKDFADNSYFLFEFKPTGYAIFEAATGEFIEGSFKTFSPFNNHNKEIKGEKLYLGFSNYYIKSGNIIYDIYNNQILDYFSKNENSYSSNFNENIVIYSNSKTSVNQKSINSRDNNIGINSFVIDGWRLIRNHEYFRELPVCPINQNGSCGFVVLAILLGFLDTYYNGYIARDQFITKSYNLDIPAGGNTKLHDKLLSYGHHWEWLIGKNGASAEDLRDTFLDYRDDFIARDYHNYFEIEYESNNLTYINDINKVKTLINNDKPTIIVMKDFEYYDPNTDESFESTWHSVLAYGYKNDKFIVHAGWGYLTSEYIISSIGATGYLSIHYTGSHIHSYNYLINDYLTCICVNCDHSYGIFRNNATTHIKRCNYCSFSVIENHNWSFNPSIGLMYCTVCGYISNVTPYGYITIFDNQLHKDVG